MRRRTFIALGAGTVGAALVAPYAVLAPGDNFEQLVGSTLGIEEELAANLLEEVRDSYGGAEYDLRAAAFSLAVRPPASKAVPAAARRSAIRGLIEPMFSTPSATRAYAITGENSTTGACSGLVRVR